jgi:hypothetical protein
MKNTSAFIISLLFCSMAAQGDQGVTSLSHPKKAYLDPVKNKLYWPMEKPVWVRLAESSDKNAPSFLLTKESDSTGTSSGIRLDISGSQFIRWQNYLTGDSVKLRFFADGEPPECSMVLSGEKTIARPQDTSGSTDAQQAIMSRPTTCYAKTVIATFSGKDRLSGVDKFYFSVNNSPYQPADGPVTFNKESFYKVMYYAVDNVGNAGASKLQTFSIDATAPITSMVFNGRSDAADTLFSRSQSLVFSSVDTISGIRETFYRFNDDKKFSVYKRPVSLRDLKDGAHTVSFYAVDNAGNEEKAGSRSFMIDDIPPVPVISFEGDRYAPGDGQEFISPRTIVKISASDNKSGIGKTEYAIENGEFITYAAPFRFAPQIKKCAIEVRVTDNAGNTSRKYRVSAKMDAEPPKTSHSVSGPLFQKSGALYITQETRITLAAKDEGSGVGSVHYRIDDAAETAYTQPISLTQEGRHLFRHRGVDKVNNSEDTQAVVIVVDTTPPTIIETFSVQTPIGDQTARSLPKYPTNTALFLAASDASGVEGIWYTVNGKGEKKYNGNLRFNETGKYTVVIKAKDILGKVGEKTVGFEIVN